MNWILVALGGAIGASLRYGVGLLMLPIGGGFPWATWLVNILGCVLAGCFFALSLNYPALQQEARLFLMVGILGGFTTFSSFGLETFQLLKTGHINVALIYVVSSVVVGILFLSLSFYLTKFVLSAE